MSERSQSRIVPTLLSGDLRRTQEYYERLGFAAEQLIDDSGRASHVGVERNGASLLFYREAPHGSPTTPLLSGTIYVFVDAVDRLARIPRRVSRQM